MICIACMRVLRRFLSRIGCLSKKTVFQATLEQIWQQTRSFWHQRDPGQVARAERDPKHKMALVFRWYLGWSSRWANTGEPNRKLDYQVWCGPAMGAFNQWVRGSFLDDPTQRRIHVMMMNILWGASVLFRIRQLQTGELCLPQDILTIRPQSVRNLQAFLEKEEVQL